MEVAERIRERTETTIVPLGPGTTGRITVSVGVAVAPDDGLDRTQVLKVADDALYRAKLAGRNRVVSRATKTDAAPPADSKPAARRGAAAG